MTFPVFSPLLHFSRFISSNFLRYWRYRLATESDVLLSLLALRRWSLPLDSETWIMSLLVCGICLYPWKLDRRMERGEREKINEWKINRKALDPSLIPPTGHLRELYLSFLLSLMDSELMPRTDPLIPFIFTLWSVLVWNTWFECVFQCKHM